MAHRIVSLGLRRAAPEPVPPGLPKRTPVRHPGLKVWRGASGRAYAHSVYSLIECPPFPMASYVLVRRDEHGRCVALRVDIGASAAPTLNLAQVRRQGALAGANEVHVWLGAASDTERRLAVCDLRAGLLGTLAAKPDAAEA